MRNVSHKSCTANQNTHFMSNSFFSSEYRAVYEIMWKNMIQPDMPQMIMQGDSVARGPKLLSIKNYVIEVKTWKFIYTYRERHKTGPVHNRCWNWSPFTSKHTWMRFSKFWNTFSQSVDVDGLNLLAYSVVELFDWAGCIFVRFALQ